MARSSENINIDSRFRNNPEKTSSSDFVVDLPTPIRNVKSLSLKSSEIPNVFYSLNSEHNTILQVRRGPDITGSTEYYTRDTWKTIVLQPGNYSANVFATELVSKIGIALNFIMSDVYNVKPISFTANTITGLTSLQLNTTSAEYLLTEDPPQSIELNLTPVDLNEVYRISTAEGAYVGISDEDKYITEIRIAAQAIETYVRNLDVGVFTLKEVMGFSDFLLYGKTIYGGTSLVNTVGVNYVLLDVNGYDTITHISKDNEVTAFAKVLFKTAKNFKNVNDSGDASTRAFVKYFDQPETIRQFRIRILDIFGNVIDLKNIDTNFVFQLEYYNTQKGYDSGRNQIIKDGELTDVKRSSGFRTTTQTKDKERLRNVVFKTR